MQFHALLVKHEYTADKQSALQKSARKSEHNKSQISYKLKVSCFRCYFNPLKRHEHSHTFATAT